MLQLTATTIENVPLAERTFRIRLSVPEIAAAIRPGQFVMLKLPGTTDPLLGRPFALYDVVGDAIDVVYLMIGKLTSKLAEFKPGQPLEIWGPLGNGFSSLFPTTPPSLLPSLTLIAGGIGQTPFLAYVRELLGDKGFGGDAPRRRTDKVNLYYGIRTAGLAAGVEDFQRAGAIVHLASDDGSVGRRGFVTDLLAHDNPAGPWIGCGPESMLHALVKLASAKGVTCHVSLETPMACGFGVCFSCVAKVKTVGGWDYKRVCVDGPVFNAAELDL